MAMSQAPISAVERRAPSSRSSAEKLPHEVLGIIMGKLEPSSLIKASQTCRVFRAAYVCNNTSLWHLMAFHYPLETLHKYFEYSKWIANTLGRPERHDKAIVRKMFFPSFHNGKLNRSLTYEQKQSGILRLEHEINRLAAIYRISGPFIERYKRDFRFTLFTCGCLLDDGDDEVWAYNLIHLDESDREQDEEEIECVLNDLTIDPMIKLKEEGWIKGIITIGKNRELDHGPDSNDIDDDEKLLEEVYSCIRKYGIDWLGGLYKGMTQFKESPFPNDISSGCELVNFSVPIVAMRSKDVEAFLYDQ